MADPTFNPVVLSNLVKLIGIVVTWGTTIYFLWVKTPPPVISAEPFFDQVRRITMLVISVFLILSWGILGNTASLRALLSIAVTLTLFGILIFFIVVSMVHRVGKTDRNHSPLPLLVGFFLYSTTISIGLTSAVEFLAVVLLNPSNASAGQSLVSKSVYSAKATLAGTQNIQDDEIVPFRASSGQGNVGCGDTLSLVATFHLPAGASIIDQPVVAWENVSNLRDPRLPPAEVAPNGDVVGRGQALGLPFQQFDIGPFKTQIRNCPGGGHGEVVVSGKYRSTQTHSQPKIIAVDSTVSAGQSEPVWVSLPSQKEWTLQRADVEFTSQTDPVAPKGTITVTPESPVAQSSDGKFKVELQMQQSRLGLSISR
jgi:hypothetical protein